LNWATTMSVPSLRYSKEHLVSHPDAIWQRTCRVHGRFWGELSFVNGSFRPEADIRRALNCPFRGNRPFHTYMTRTPVLSLQVVQAHAVMLGRFGNSRSAIRHRRPWSFEATTHHLHCLHPRRTTVARNASRCISAVIAVEFAVIS